MTGKRIGELHRVAEMARTMRPTLPTAAELRAAMAAPRTDILSEVLAEAIWPADRPLRVPAIGHRP